MERWMCFGGFYPAKNVEVPPTPVGRAPLEDHYARHPATRTEDEHATQTAGKFEESFA